MTKKTTDETGDTETDSSTSSKIPDTAQSKEDIAVEETVDTVTVPELENVIVDDVVTELDEEDNVTIVSGSLVKISGTADAGDTVAVFLG